MSEDEKSDTEDKEEAELGVMEDQRSIILHLISQLKLGMDLTKVGWHVPLGLRLVSLLPTPIPSLPYFLSLHHGETGKTEWGNGIRARISQERVVFLCQYSSQSVSLAFDSLEELLP